MSSCISSKKILYFQDLPDSSSQPTVMNQTAKFVDPKIQSNDILAITLQTEVQNNGNSPITTNSQGTFNPLNGFLVDKNGYIELLFIGFVKVGGLTTAEARELIKQKYKELFNNPVVNVRIANFDISVLGDVAKPGIINMPSEKVSILDAISMTGDLNLTAKRDNILLIRNDSDKQTSVRFDLTSAKVFQSPYFWLKQRDLIYVEPSRNKIQSSDNLLLRNLSILSSLISIVSFALIFKSVK